MPVMAVYTTLTQKNYDEIAALYGFASIDAAHPIAEGVENSNYLLEYTNQEDTKNRAILTIFEQRVETVDIPFYLKLKQHLFEKNMHCPQPYHTKDGFLSCKIGEKHAAIVSFLDGTSVLHPTVGHVRQAGAILARMHLAAKDFPMTRANAMSFDGWHALRARIAERQEKLEDGMLALIDEELGFVSTHWPHALPSGIIHGDMFPNNVFFDASDTLSGVIDFYFACYDLWAYDLAIVANAWCFNEAGQCDEGAYSALLDAYDRVRPLSDDERDAMPVLLRAAAMRFLLTRVHDVLYHDPNALLTPHDPQDYVRILRYHQQRPLAA